MKKQLFKLFYLIVVSIFLAISGYGQSGFIEPASEELISQLNKADDILFTAVFENCDIHRGSHKFYQLIEGEYKFVETAKFTHLWKKAGDTWLVSRVFSYDHTAAE